MFFALVTNYFKYSPTIFSLRRMSSGGSLKICNLSTGRVINSTLKKPVYVRHILANLTKVNGTRNWYKLSPLFLVKINMTSEAGWCPKESGFVPNSAAAALACTLVIKKCNHGYNKKG